MRRAAPSATFARTTRVIRLSPRGASSWFRGSRRADDADSDSIAELLEGMEDADEMVLAFDDAVEARARGEAAAVVATCEGTIVGYATFALEVDLEPLAACFDLARVIHLDAHAADGYAQLEECVMNPCVRARARKTVVTEALVCASQDVRVVPTRAPGTTSPSPRGGHLGLPPRRRSTRSRKSRRASRALRAHPRVAHTPRTAVNARVVIVGGSETALATAERSSPTRRRRSTTSRSSPPARSPSAAPRPRTPARVSPSWRSRIAAGWGSGWRPSRRRFRRARPRRARTPRRRRRAPVRDVGGVPRARGPDPPRDGRRGRCPRRASS